MTVYHDLKKTLRALTRLIVMTCATLGLQGVILASLIGLRVKARKLNVELSAIDGRLAAVSEGLATPW
jgi:hypothetical protein